MNYDKALIISRYHDDMANPIYNAYIKGIESQCKIIHFIDYFDQLAILGKSGFEKQVETLLTQEHINLIFFIFVSGDPILDPYFIQKIAKNRFIAMVFWDMEQFFEQIDRYYAQLADLVILPANYEYIYKLKSLNINAISSFSLFDSTKYRPLPNQTRSIDVSFVGEVTKGNRQEYIDYLKQNGMNVQTYGNGTENGKVSFDRVVEIFNTSKINLSFTGTYDNSIYTYCLNINNRIKQNKGKPIEIALCGGFVLTQYVPGIEKMFNSSDIDTFTTKEELLKKVKYYLSHDRKRNQMAKNSYTHALNNYDCVTAFKKIFITIRSITPKTNKRVILDNIFIKIHTTFHVFYFLAFLFQKKWRLAFEELKFIKKYKKFIYKDVNKFLIYEIDKQIQKRKIQKKCNILFKKLANRPIVIYGAGRHTTNLYDKIKNIKLLNVKAIADKNEELWGKKFHNITIISPEHIREYADDVIISSFAFEQEINKELSIAYKNQIHIYMIYNNEFTAGLSSSRHIDPYQTFRDMLTLK